MVPFIYTAQDIYRVPSEEALRMKQAKALRALQRQGSRLQVHEDTRAIFPYVDANQWLADCTCGSGVGLNPEWSAGYCFGCGAIYRRIVWPPDRETIELALLARQELRLRNWHPPETLADLRAENAMLGLSEV